MAQEQKTATDMQTAEMDIFKRLRQAGYSPNDANGLIRLASIQASGKNAEVTVSSNNPFTRNIQLADLNKVAKALTDVKKNPGAEEQIVGKLDIKGPEKMGSGSSGSTQLTGVLCTVQVGSHTYTAQLTKSLEGTGIKQQLSDLIKTGGVLQVTEFNTVTGQDVAVTNSTFREAYNRAFSEDPGSVKVKPLKRG